MNTGYSTAEAQQAFLNLPPDDQQVLELQHWIAADAMNLVHNEYSTSQVEPILLHSIDNLEMTTRTTNLLKSLEIYLIGQLIQLTAQELLRPAILGPKTLKEVENVLQQHDLRLGMKLSDKEYEAIKAHIR